MYVFLKSKIYIFFKYINISSPSCIILLRGVRELVLVILAKICIYILPEFHIFIFGISSHVLGIHANL